MIGNILSKRKIVSPYKNNNYKYLRDNLINVNKKKVQIRSDQIPTLIIAFITLIFIGWYFLTPSPTSDKWANFHDSMNEGSVREQARIDSPTGIVTKTYNVNDVEITEFIPTFYLRQNCVLAKFKDTVELSCK